MLTVGLAGGFKNRKYSIRYATAITSRPSTSLANLKNVLAGIFYKIYQGHYTSWKSNLFLCSFRSLQISVIFYQVCGVAGWKTKLRFERELRLHLRPFHPIESSAFDLLPAAAKLCSCSYSSQNKSGQISDLKFKVLEFWFKFLTGSRRIFSCLKFWEFLQARRSVPYLGALHIPMPRVRVIC